MVNSVSSFDFMKLSGVRPASQPAAAPAKPAARPAEPEGASLTDKLKDAAAKQDEIDQLRQKMRDKVLEEMDADKDSLGRLAGQERDAFTRRLDAEIDRRTREALTEGTGPTAAGQAAPPVLFDISV